jgi:hypothetical protein
MAFHSIPSDFIALLNITQLVQNSLIEYCITQLARIVIESWTASRCPPCDPFGTHGAQYWYSVMDRSSFLAIDQGVSGGFLSGLSHFSVDIVCVQGFSSIRDFHLANTSR